MARALLVTVGAACSASTVDTGEDGGTRLIADGGATPSSGRLPGSSGAVSSAGSNSRASTSAVGASSGSTASSSSRAAVSGSSRPVGSGSGVSHSSGGAVSNSSAAATSVPSDPFNAATYCQASAAAACARVARCNPFDLAFYYEDETTCVTYMKSHCTADVPALQAILGHTVSFNQAQSTACNDLTRTGACALDLTMQAACVETLVGHAGLNAPCFSNLQCVTGLYCGGVDSVTSCGTCMPRAALNAPCGAAVACLEGFACLITNATAGTGTCHTYGDVWKGVGQACDSSVGTHCQGDLYCHRTTAAAAGTCTAVTVLAARATCNPALDNQSCPASQQCTKRAASGQCTDLGALNSTCDFSLGQYLCGPGLFCSAWEATPGPTGVRPAGTCVARRGAAGACGDADLADAPYLACQGNLDCTAGTCSVPSAGAVPACL